MHTDQRLGRADIADRIVGLVSEGRAGQPLLFCGPVGAGKEVTALGIARRLNCVDPDHCGQPNPCESCRKALTFQHPDIRWFGPAPAPLEDQKNAPKVRAIFEAKMADPFHEPPFAATAQVLIGNPENPGPLTVRGLMQFVRRQSFQGRWKVAVVADAHRMNKAAANAFLKTLEEPPPATLLMLLTSRPSSLLPTIISRCQKVNFEPYPEDQLHDVMASLRPETDAVVREDAARLAGGDARRALSLLEPEMQTLLAWSSAVFGEVNEGRGSVGQVAAEHLNAGFLPTPQEDGSVNPRAGKTDDTAVRRRRALVFCEMLGLLTGETLACASCGQNWQPRLAAQSAMVRRVALVRRTASLLADLERIERAKHDIDGNLNLGLVMAGLCEDLSTHVRRDQVTTSA